MQIQNASHFKDIMCMSAGIYYVSYLGMQKGIGKFCNCLQNIVRTEPSKRITNTQVALEKDRKEQLSSLLLFALFCDLIWLTQ